VSKPFAGVRILDFTRCLGGPYGTYQLALLGADVVKIEARDGDETRAQPGALPEARTPTGAMIKLTEPIRSHSAATAS
jgi:crotonobetainyl-CoA:carnitine CoA-transferase CaiB-like acyl-CoA transferase